MFAGRRLLIATKHKKERVIAPVLERELGVTCFVDESLDTDLLGTFTGEVERQADPLSVARTKCLTAMEKNGCDLAVASEGSFGPHPEMFFVPADEELMILVDQKHQLEIKASLLSLDTNFAGQFVQTREALETFLGSVQFPEHAVILRKNREEPADICKGITDYDTALRHFLHLHGKYGKAFIETDMRAMFNPTRMQVIGQLTEKLVKRVQAQCPSCGRPGFDISEIIPGLPCEQCFTPTRAALAYMYQCAGCMHTEKKWYPNGVRFQQPMYCDTCNP